MPRAASLALALAAIAAVTAVFHAWPHLTNPTTAALAYLLIVFVTATGSTLWVALTVSVLADLCLNYFFMPPFGTLAIADPPNWVALFVFLAVSVMASQLAAAARDRARQTAAADAARREEQLKSALLASLAHDLRTPLTAIRVAASNLQAAWLPEGERREQSDLILAEVERLNRMFENILEMARIDAGALEAERRWVHPAEIVEAARDQVPHALRRHPVVTTAESDDLVMLDPRLTASALAQLLENAGRYAPLETAIAVRISVSSEGLAIRVRDRGPGIDPADLPHLFDRFYRGAAARRRVSGTGMGLAIARGMVAAQGGSIAAGNGPDGGAEFTIVVPAEHRAAAAAAAV